MPLGRMHFTATTLQEFADENGLELEKVGDDFVFVGVNKDILVRDRRTRKRTFT